MRRSQPGKVWGASPSDRRDGGQIPHTGNKLMEAEEQKKGGRTGAQPVGLRRQEMSSRRRQGGTSYRQGMVAGSWPQWKRRPLKSFSWKWGSMILFVSFKDPLAALRQMHCGAAKGEAGTWCNHH